jgi:hypothetical protein
VWRANQTGSAHCVFPTPDPLIYFWPIDDIDRGRRRRSGRSKSRGVEIARVPTKLLCVSPDGKWIAVGDTSDMDATSGSTIGRASARRRRDVRWEESVSVWSSDSRRVIYQSDREGDGGLFLAARRRNRAHPSALQSRSRNHAHSGLVFADQLLFSVTKATSSLRLLTQTKGSRRSARSNPARLLTASSHPMGDGWPIPYGKAPPAIYVQPFPTTGAKVSDPAERIHPVWTRTAGNPRHVEEAGLSPSASRASTVRTARFS